jgi:hypothetical protein
LSGFEAKFEKYKPGNAHELVAMMRNTKLKEFQIDVYGVRKTDIETIKMQKNWVNLETYLTDTLKSLSNKIMMAGIKSSIENDAIFRLRVDEVVTHLNDGETKELLCKFLGIPKDTGHASIKELMSIFRNDQAMDFKAEASKYNDKFKAFSKRYPLIEVLERHMADPVHIADYINVIDKVKGI